MHTRYYLGLLIIFLIVVAVLGGYFCYTAEVVDKRHASTGTHYTEVSVTGPIQPIPAALTTDIKWVRLGKALFNSKLLSRDNSIACASCHLVNFGGDDGFPVSTGIDSQTGERNSPTVLNAVFNFRQFWDGRSQDLAAQIEGPIHNAVEMGSNWSEVIGKLEGEPQFKRAFLDVSAEGVTQANIIQAITRFEETLITPGAPIDKYLLGDKSALTAQQVRGYKKFVEFGCVTCHQGKNIGGNLFQKIGRIDAVPAVLLDDLGLYDLTQVEEDKYVFKVPSLRNIADTAPYFHNGSVETLSEAVQIMAQGQLGLTLTQQDVEDLVALLQAFSGKLYPINDYAPE